MADIKKKLSELQTLYADNTTGDISPNDLRDGFKSVVGSLYITSADSNFTLTADDIYADIDTTSGNVTVTIPNANASDGSGDTYKHKYFILNNTGTNDVILTSGFSHTLSQNQAVSIISNGQDWKIYNKYQSNDNNTFVGLADTPANYTNSSGYFTQVSSAGDALEFNYIHVEDVKYEEDESFNLRQLINDQNYNNSVQGFDLVELGSGAVSVSSGLAFVKETSAGFDSKLVPAVTPGTSSQTLTDNATTYIFAKHKVGTDTEGELVFSTNVNDIFRNDYAILHFVTRVGNDVNHLNLVNYASNYATNNARKDALVNGFERADGGALVVGSNDTFTLDAATYFLVNKLIPVQSFDTSASDTFTYSYRDGLGDYTRVTGQTQFDGTKYDDGTGTLATVTNVNKYTVHWLHYLFNQPTKLHVMYGHGEYDKAVDAYGAAYPADRPYEVAQYSTGEEIYKVIYKGDGTFVEAIDLKANPEQNHIDIDHNETNNKQGGIGGEYYHLTANEYAFIPVSSAHVSSANIHTPLNDSSSASDVVWSGNKIQTELDGKSDIGHSHTLGFLTDVTITNPVNTQALVYSSATSTWVNSPISSPATSSADNSAGTIQTTHIGNCIGSIDFGAGTTQYPRYSYISISNDSKSLDRIRFFVYALSGTQSVDVGIYKINGSNYDKVTEGTVSTSATGFVDANLTIPVDLDAGELYTLAIMRKTSTGSLSLAYASTLPGSDICFQGSAVDISSAGLPNIESTKTAYNLVPWMMMYSSNGGTSDLNLWNTVSVTNNYSASRNDVILGDTSISGAFNVTLPLANDNKNKEIKIKKISSDNNNITVDTTGADTIDGLSTQIISTANTSITVISNGINWFIV